MFLLKTQIILKIDLRGSTQFYVNWLQKPSLVFFRADMISKIESLVIKKFFHKKSYLGSSNLGSFFVLIVGLLKVCQQTLAQKRLCHLLYLEHCNPKERSR